MTKAQPIIEFCEAELRPGSETFSCFRRPNHNGPHKEWHVRPCRGCFGVSAHADDCNEEANLSYAEQAALQRVEVYWNDAGEWWLNKEEADV